MKPENTKPGEERHLYTDMKCCLHPCSVFDCPESICFEEFRGLAAYRRYQEALRVFSECTDINEAAKALGIHPTNALIRRKWLKSLT